MKKLPPLRALHAFEAFGRLGSVAATADELSVTSGAISQQLKLAEAAVGFRLLERNGKNLSLTNLGKSYHAKITVAFDQLRRAGAEIGALRAETPLMLSCLPSLASKWLGPPLFDWQADSGANVRLVGASSEPRAGDEPIDFRISYGDRVSSFENYTELFTDWVVPACSPAYLAKHPVIHPRDILDCSLLDIQWDSGYQQPPSWSDWAEGIGARRYPTGRELRFSISSAAIDAAINGRGFVLAQLSMVRQDLTAGRLVAPLDQRMKLSQTYYLAWHRGALEKPSAIELRNWIIKLSRLQSAMNLQPLPKPVDK